MASTPPRWSAAVARLRRGAAYWRARKARARKGTEAYGHAAGMLAKREQQVAAKVAERPVSPRAKAVQWAKAQVGTTENPPGSNRGGRITEWQTALGAWLVGTAWCGTFCAAALRAAGVQGIGYRLASVAFIEDDARAGRRPFRGWTTDPTKVRRGDLVVLFGRGTHVELVVGVVGGVVETVGGNTSAGTVGSQDNGGGVFRRARPLSAVHGFALVNYPG